MYSLVAVMNSMFIVYRNGQVHLPHLRTDGQIAIKEADRRAPCVNMPSDSCIKLLCKQQLVLTEVSH